MTEIVSILAALDRAEVLTADGSPVSDDVARVMRGAEEIRVEGVEDPTEAEGAAMPLAPRDLGYDIEAMNRRHALVLVGSKSVVMDENPTAPIEERHAFRTIEAFNAWYSNRPTEIVAADGKVKVMPWSARWMRDRARRQYSGVCFFPNPDGARSPEGYYNLWRGFSVEPRRGGSYAILKDHILTNICEGNLRIYAWIFGFFAQMVQRPRERIGVALVFRGKMGVGKTIVGEVMGSLIAAHFFQVDDPRYVTGNFNAHMAQCLLLQAEEAVWAGDKVAEGRLKGLITAKIQMIENKGVDPIRVENFIRLLMTSNEGWVVPAGKDERRYAVFDVSDRCKENHEYFAEMMQELDDGGREALLADLLSFDLSSINLRVIPKTKALLEQKIRSLNSVESWWFERLKEGTTRRKADFWETEVERVSMFEDYLEKSDKVGIKRRSIETEVGMDLAKLVPAMKDCRPRVGSGKRPRVYLFPPLAECRASFEAAVGQTVEWGDDGVGEGRIEGKDDEWSNP